MFESHDHNLALVHPKARDYYINQGKLTFLLIHGFTGSPFDFRNLAEYFKQKGWSIRAIRLPGHGLNEYALMDAGFEHYRNQVKQEIEFLTKQGKEIYIIGHSFGGNLAIDAAIRFGNAISGLILFSPAIYLKYEKLIKIILPLYRRLFKFYRKPIFAVNKFNLFKKSKPIINNQNGAYNIIPTEKLAELFKFINHYTKKQLFQLKIACLLIHPKRDKVVHVKSSHKFYHQLKNNSKTPARFLLLDSKDHTPFKENYKFLGEKIERFVKKIKMS